MKNLINIAGISTVDFIYGHTGEFRVIVKVQGGFVSCVDCRVEENERYSTDPSKILDTYKSGAIQTVEFKPAGTNHWLTVFARKGKTIVFIDESILENLEVGTINQLFLNTDLYNKKQYKAVNAKTWADKAFVMNESEKELVNA